MLIHSVLPYNLCIAFVNTVKLGNGYFVAEFLVSDVDLTCLVGYLYEAGPFIALLTILPEHTDTSV